MTASVAPGWTTAPGASLTVVTVPATGARSVFSIFIASRVTMGSPASTWSPSATA